MRTTKRILLSLITILFSLFSVNAISDAEAPEILWEEASNSRVAAVDNEQYKKSCGSCHDAYQAGLLPPHSWEKISLDVDNHFGKKIKLERSEQKEVLNYLLGNAAGRSRYVLSSLLLTGLKEGNPMRITKLPYFLTKHKDLTGNLSACSSCHSNATQGSFDKKEIKK